MSWSAQQYLTFESERTRPVFDLITGLGPAQAQTVVDLGCGPGNSTAVLKVRFPDARMCGIDNSEPMIESARKRLPDCRFEVQSIETWEAETPADLVFSNAALHWVPDHAALLPRLLRSVASGGHLAIQVPDNLDEPAHRLMRVAAQDGPWGDKLAQAETVRTALGSPRWYFQLLQPHARRIEVWRTVYHHALAGGIGGVIEWFKATGLRPYLGPLDAAEQQEFLGRYRALLGAAYPLESDGSVLLPFPRLFIVAQR